MFAGPTQKNKPPAHEKTARAEVARDRKDAGVYNPVWQTFALNSLSLQPKLAVSQPDDPYEREADHIADRVMRMAAPPTEDSKLSFSHHAAQAAQRKCNHCEEEEENKLRRKPDSDGDSSVAPATAVSDVLNQPGEPLDPSTRGFFEPRFGQSFDDVRVHTGARAGDAAQSVEARAFTLGTHVVFGRGQYSPHSEPSKRLLAHELTHVVQQRTDPSTTLARAPLDVEGIVKDVEAGSLQISPFVRPMSIAFIKNRPAGFVSGDLTMAADYPTTFTVPTDKTKKVKKLPKADATPPASNIPVVGHFFPAPFAGNADRALVVGGFHGDEHPGWEVADKLVDEGKSGSLAMAFHTLVIPRVNAAAIADELAGVSMWRNRCNRQLVDLNRNFPTGNDPKDTDCANTKGAPVQPEVQAVMDVVTKFNPSRILSTHAISKPKSAGVFADPNIDPQAIEIAKGMSATLVHESDRPFNKLGPGKFNPVYPKDKPGVVGAGTSLGAWGPTAGGATNRPVITMEAPKFESLGTGPGTEPRTLEGFMRPVRAFLVNPASLATQADRDILSDIDAFTAADQLGFLTGKLSSKNDIFRRIDQRVKMAIAKLNEMGPPKKIKPVSTLRFFSEGTNQSDIVFNKFFLVGGMEKKGKWDTLPAEFHIDGDPKKKPDVTKWRATPTKDRFEIIVKYSALPGASRHHWSTEVDVNSVKVEDWEPGGKFAELGEWLTNNSAKAGLIQSYNPSRPAGGYSDEPWHLSYAPIAVGLLERYNQTVNLQTDVIDAIVAEFEKRAKAKKLKMPADFATGLAQIDISSLVKTVHPAVQPPP
ncbi:MAG TPA: DUF4157 domain-containing protein [Pyrinomonadaceae bacterium]